MCIKVADKTVVSTFHAGKVSRKFSHYFRAASKGVKVTFSLRMFQLSLGRRAAAALAQNNGTEYDVGNIHDTICK
jgi:hypothetical protein